MTDADKIFEAIRQDPDNADFTAQGWDPLYHIELKQRSSSPVRHQDEKHKRQKHTGMIRAAIGCELGWASPKISFITAVKLRFCR